MAEPVVDLFTMSDEELDRRLRDAAKMVPSPSFNDYLHERVRRGQDRQTRNVVRLTVVATVAAVFSVVTSVFQVYLAYLALR